MTCKPDGTHHNACDCREEYFDNPINRLESSKVYLDRERYMLNKFMMKWLIFQLILFFGGFGLFLLSITSYLIRSILNGFPTPDPPYLNTEIIIFKIGLILILAYFPSNIINLCAHIYEDFTRK